MAASPSPVLQRARSGAPAAAFIAQQNTDSNDTDGGQFAVRRSRSYVEIAEQSPLAPLASNHGPAMDAEHGYHPQHQRGSAGDVVDPETLDIRRTSSEAVGPHRGGRQARLSHRVPSTPGMCSGHLDYSFSVGASTNDAQLPLQQQLPRPPSALPPRSQISSTAEHGVEGDAGDGVSGHALGWLRGYRSAADLQRLQQSQPLSPGHPASSSASSRAEGGGGPGRSDSLRASSSAAPLHSTSVSAIGGATAGAAGRGSIPGSGSSFGTEGTHEGGISSGGSSTSDSEAAAARLLGEGGAPDPSLVSSAAGPSRVTLRRLSFRRQTSTEMQALQQQAQVHGTGTDGEDTRLHFYTSSTSMSMSVENGTIASSSGDGGSAERGARAGGAGGNVEASSAGGSELSRRGASLVGPPDPDAVTGKGVVSEQQTRERERERVRIVVPLDPSGGSGGGGLKSSLSVTLLTPHLHVLGRSQSGLGATPPTGFLRAGSSSSGEREGGLLGEKGGAAGGGPGTGIGLAPSSSSEGGYMLPQPPAQSSSGDGIASEKGGLRGLLARLSRSRAAGWATSLCLTLAVLLGYGLSLFVNSITGQLLGAETAGQALFLLSIGRAFTLVGVLPVLLLLGMRPPPTLVLHWSLAVPAVVAVAGNCAFLAYYALVAGGEVSVLSPMVGLYSVIPVTVGLVWRGEDRTWTKLVGIGLSFVAVLVLGFSGNTFSSSGAALTSADVALKVVYFLVCWAVWGANDTFSSAVVLDPFTVASSSLAGQLLCCAVFGLYSFIDFVDMAAPTVPFGWPHVAVMGANALAIIGWLSFVRLGQIGQASSFIPIISLYTYVPVLLSVALLGETLNAMRIAGLVIAGFAVLLISATWKAKPVRSPSSTVTGPGGR